MLNSLFKNKKNIVPFKNDLLFHFFNKKTIISDTYIQDPKSNLKLYPRKSNNIVTTSVNTQIHVSKLAVAPVTGSDYFEISIDVYYDPATLNTSSYENFVCGRGDNTGMHSGMQLPGRLNETAFEGRWRLQNTGSTISKTGLTADWYRYSMTVTETTFQIKLLNLRTNVLSLGNVVGIGTVNNADNFRFTILCYGINGSTGAYGTVGVNFSNARITRNGGTLVNIPFSAGAGTQVINVYNGSVYDLGFFTPSAGWAKLSDYYHYNFRKGFTLYTKSGSSDIRISNKIDGTETTYTPPTGYARIANYKGTTTTFNQCESKFKLDDVTLNQDLIVTGAGDAVLNGVYPLRGQYNGRNWYYDGKLSGLSQWTHSFNWDGTQWVWSVNPGTIVFYGVGDVQTPMECTSWTPAIGTLPVGIISNGGEKCTLSGTTTPANYNGEYHEIGLWAGNKLFGKVGDEENKHIWKNGTPWDVYGWIVGAIESQGYWWEYVNGDGNDDGNDDTVNPWDVASFTPFPFVGATGTGILVESVSNDNDLYNADPDRVLFTEGTGVAKEVSVASIYSGIMQDGKDLGHLYINDSSDANFMLYKTDKGVDTPADLKIWAYVEK